MSMFSALRVTTTALRRPLHCVNHLRRWLATEALLRIDSSPEFLEEEFKRTGKRPEVPEASEEEQKAHYEEFLEQKAKEGPLRPQLNVLVDPNHGLWAFFRSVEKNGEQTFETVEEHVPGKSDRSGRSWSAFELRRKSFKDLHALWYILLRERNLLATQKAEATRLGIPISTIAVVDKERKCRKSMARIKQVINERRVAYERAVALVYGKNSTQEADEATISLDVLKQPTVTKGRRRRLGPSTAAIYRANAFRETQTQGAEKKDVEVESAAESDSPLTAPEPIIQVNQTKVA